MIQTIHKTAGVLAFAAIALFWLSTAVSEAALGPAAVVTVKTLIPWGFLILIPLLATAGGTGFRLAKGRTAGPVGVKRKRMPFIAANGVLVLVPSALFLASKAQAGALDAAFYAVQALELAAGAVNLALLGLNLRDGRRMTAGQRGRAGALQE
ncbi:hypothetical protein LHP98_17165 [Rhodobacter sp. Har01]|uniref:hypothetical protein n=1 Tax=Rhodobacter sp. Har01 TaxID=2883999 RepID=UPI001D07B481|nr:hypothetical protein [Rhodobacter sp. Har01]MCB6179854.1 hypothetical protein [Rhodobacter sp. Har01]